MTSALIVFAKTPVAGEVKTRLTPPFSPDDAALLYAAFLEDSLKRFAALQADVRLYIADDRREDAARTAFSGRGVSVPGEVRILNQKGSELGARMASAFDETFAAGYSRVVIVGSDHPTLPVSFIERAFAALRRPQAVSIGPAEDGGYYLLGLTRPHPALFRDMQYSHGSVFEDTMSRIDAMKAAVTILPSWYDVDRPAELIRLASDLEDDPTIAPRTRAALRRLMPSDASTAW